MVMDKSQGHEESVKPAGKSEEHGLSMHHQISGPSLPIVGSLRVLTSEDEEVFSTGEVWDADSEV